MNELITKDGALTQQASNMIFFYKEQMKKLKAQEEEFNKQLLQELKKHGYISYKDENMTISVIEPTEKVTFDSDSFKKKFPDIYEKFAKKTPVKGSVRVTLKKGVTSENMTKEVHPEIQKIEVIGADLDAKTNKIEW